MARPTSAARKTCCTCWITWHTAHRLPPPRKPSRLRGKRRWPTTPARRWMRHWCSTARPRARSKPSRFAGCGVPPAKGKPDGGRGPILIKSNCSPTHHEETMHNVRSTFTLTVTALAAALALAAAPSQAQDKPIALKLSSWVPAQHPLNPSLQAWVDDIKKASNGTLSGTLFPSEQLGKAFDHYDMARDGITDFAYVNPGYQPGRFPVMAGASLPFLFANGKGGTAAIDAWYKQYAAQEMKDVKVCFAFVHDPGTFHARKKITLPTDIKGMKIRPATSTIGQMVTSLGGTNVQSSAPEARDMLERGVADAITFPWGSIPLFGIDKVVSFHMDVP